MNKQETKLIEHLNFLYGDEKAQIVYINVMALLNRFKQDHPDLVNHDKNERINEKDVILITYGDMVKDEGEKPLKTLGRVLKEYLVDLISTVHIQFTFFHFFHFPLMMVLQLLITVKLILNLVDGMIFQR